MPPSPPTSPRITFASQRELYVLGQLLDQHRRRTEPEHRLQGLIVSFEIYDHYAQAYRMTRQTMESQFDSWRILAMTRIISEMYALMLTAQDELRLGDTEFQLPLQSVSSFHPHSAPIGARERLYKLQRITSAQFAEIAWLVRCNLLHGRYDPAEEGTWQIINKTARPMMGLVWEMLLATVP